MRLTAAFDDRLPLPFFCFVAWDVVGDRTVDRIVPILFAALPGIPSGRTLR